MGDKRHVEVGESNRTCLHNDSSGVRSRSVPLKSFSCSEPLPLIKLVGGEAEAGEAWLGWMRVLRVAMEVMQGYVLILLSCLERSNVIRMISTEAGLGVIGPQRLSSHGQLSTAPFSFFT